MLKHKHYQVISPHLKDMFLFFYYFLFLALCVYVFTTFKILFLLGTWNGKELLTFLCNYSFARSTKQLDVYQLVGADMFPQIILKVQFCCRVYSKDFSESPHVYRVRGYLCQEILLSDLCVRASLVSSNMPC